jgi:hypothetical protein
MVAMTLRRAVERLARAVNAAFPPPPCPECARLRIDAVRIIDARTEEAARRLMARFPGSCPACGFTPDGIRWVVFGHSEGPPDQEPDSAAHDAWLAEHYRDADAWVEGGWAEKDTTDEELAVRGLRRLPGGPPGSNRLALLE